MSKYFSLNKKQILLCFASWFLLLNSIRADFGQKFEPPDGRVIHGLGQYVGLGFYTDAENWQYVSEYQTALGQIPVIYSAYAYVDPQVAALDNTDLTDIATNHGYPYVLQVGLALFDITSEIGSVNIPVQAILDGDSDTQIRQIADEIKSLNRTAFFLRPGFEFGSGNGGLHNDPDNADWTAENFINIWIHIYDLFQQENVTNVAWVWNTVNPQSFDFIDWYPGDQYVDWWGINYFTASQMSSGDPFLDSAAGHEKPVMICESSPIENGGTTNISNWNDWFVPYFNKIKTVSHVKAFVYISDPWDKTGYFDGWPDSRINSDSSIKNNYQSELDNPIYIHMDEYENNPGIIDSPLPITLSSFTVEVQQNANLITWKTESEINNLGFNVYRAVNYSDRNVSELEFIKINPSIIPGAGSSSISHYYQFRDEDIIENCYYWYQLEDVDNNGNTIRHDVIKIYRNFSVPSEFVMMQNYPNPFNQSTTIQVDLPYNSDLAWLIFTSLGERVCSEKIINKVAGQFNIIWDGKNRRGIELPSGIYFMKINTDYETRVQKLMLVR